MRANMAIRLAHCLLTVFLLILVGAFLYINHTGDTRVGDTLQHRYKVNDHLWLYTTENRAGSATVPTFYRFYLTEEITGNDKIVMEKLKTESPFLKGSGSISQILSIDDEHIEVTYSGKVYSLSDTVSYFVTSHQVNARVSYHIN